MLFIGSMMSFCRIDTFIKCFFIFNITLEGSYRPLSSLHVYSSLMYSRINTLLLGGIETYSAILIPAQESILLFMVKEYRILAYLEFTLL